MISIELNKLVENFKNSKKEEHISEELKKLQKNKEKLEKINNDLDMLSKEMMKEIITCDDNIKNLNTVIKSANDNLEGLKLRCKKIEETSDNELAEILKKEREEINNSSEAFKITFIQKNKNVYKKNKDELNKKYNDELKTVDTRIENNNELFKKFKDNVEENLVKLKEIENKNDNIDKEISDIKEEHKKIINLNSKKLLEIEKEFEKTDLLVSNLTDIKFEPFESQKENEIKKIKADNKENFNNLQDRIKNFNDDQIKVKKEQVNLMINELNRNLIEKNLELKNLEDNPPSYPEEDIINLKMNINLKNNITSKFNEYKNLKSNKPEMETKLEKINLEKKIY